MRAERNTAAQVATEPPPGNSDDNAADAAARREREARSEALERTYVHDVYRQMAGRLCEMRRRPWPRVKQFLSELEPGSLVCDVGCGDGRYLSLNADAYFVGVDRCARLAEAAATAAAGAGAAHTRHQVVVCDALGLPLRDASVDAAVSVAVIHHLATTERRVRALRELARVLRIGGRLIVTVWALEQRTRKFESQDVLVPWNQPSTCGSGEDQTSTGEPEAISTTSDDDLLNYSAFTQTSDSDSSRSTRFQVRRSGRRPRRIRSIDPTLVSSSQSSSGLSSPSESCYSFVRRALQKLARRGEVDGSRPWILLPWTGYTEAKQAGAKPGEAAADGQLIEIRLDDDTASLEETPRRRNTLGCDQPSQGQAGQQLGAFKSRSVGDMWSLLSASVLAARRPQSKRGVEQGMASNTVSDRPRSFAFDESTSVEMGRSQSSVSALLHQQSARKGSRKSVTFSTQSLTLPRERQPLTVIGEKSKSDSVLDGHGRPCELMRVSLTTVPENEARDCDDNDTPSAKPALVRQQRLTEEPAAAAPSRVHSEEGPPLARRPARGILKQTSLNENLMRRDWASERAEIRGRIRKQQSLNENVIYGKLAGVQQPAAAGSFASYSRLRALRDNLGKLSESLEKRAEKDAPAAGSLKNGLVKIVRQFTEGATAHNDVIVVRETPNSNESSQLGGDQNKQTAPPPVKAGSSCPDEGKEAVPNCADEQCERVVSVSEPAMKSACPAPTSPYSHTRTDRRSLYRYCSRERKTSREESSDSSKENSFQSDTSLDSEDSCVSVIYVPKVPADADSRQRSRSASSESSDGSNGKLSPKSPLTLSLPLSPTRLAVSPTRLGTAKGSVTLGAQVLQSNLQGRFQLMDPPCGTGVGGNVGTCTSTFKAASNPATTEVQPDLKAVASVAPLQASRLSAPTRVALQKEEPNVPKDVSSSVSAVSQAKTPEGCALVCQEKESVPVKLKRSPDEDMSARPVPLPDVVPCSASSRAHLSATAALASVSASPPSPAPSKACDSTSFHFQPGGGATAAPCPASSRAGVSSQVSSLIMGENIEIIRRPGVQGLRSVQILRRPAPKYLTFEVFNPETDDLDSESSCASSSSSEASSPSSASSACSVVSLATDWPSARELRQLDNEIEQQQQQQQDGRGDQPLSTSAVEPTAVPTSGSSHLAAPCETDDSLSSSPEPPARLSSPRGRRKTTLARLELPPLEQVLEEVEPPRASLLSNLPTSKRWPGSLTELGDLEAAGDHCPLLAPPDAEPARVPPGPALTASAIFDRAEAAATEAADKEGAASSEESAAWTQGGTLGHHRYYHVFREGELDRLIEKYVDNLHIISSYYDHANWCVIAEKVQVWTI